MKNKPTTICSQCAHCATYNYGVDWSLKFCLKAPCTPDYDPITGKNNKEGEFLLCRSVNDGNCVNFEQAPPPVKKPIYIVEWFKKLWKKT